MSVNVKNSFEDIKQLVSTIKFAGDKDKQVVEEELTLIEKFINSSLELIDGLEWRKKSYKRNLDRGFDEDGEPLTYTNEMIERNLYNMMCALQGYFEHE